MLTNKIKNKLNNISIKWKFFIYLFCFSATLLLILWSFQVLFLDDFYKYIKISLAKKNANIVANNISDDNIQHTLDQLAIDNDCLVQIWSEDTKILYSSDKFKKWLIDSMSITDRHSLIYSTAKNNGSLIAYYTKDGFIPKSFNRESNIIEQTLIYCKLVKDKDGSTNFIVINSLIKPVNETVSTIKIQLYFITFIMILCSIVLALIIAKRVAMPIEKINNSTKKLSKGQYDINFTEGSYKEINELSNTLTIVTKELSKVETLRKELIANISHDLRTPLTLIKGYAEVMRDLPDENNVENVQIIIDETERLTTLVNDILNLSKFQSGAQNLNITSYNLTEALEEIIIRMNKLIKKDGYNIRFIYDKKITIEADESKISQCFYNLLVNAINYSGQDKSVIVTQSTKNNMVKIQVIDTGEGISPNELPYIWDRYYKSLKNHKRPITGTGIGLSIVKSIIELHEGQYGVESEVGNGSTFWFKIKI